MRPLTRRQLVQAASLLAMLRATSPRAANDNGLIRSELNSDVEYGQRTLPPGVRSRRINNNNGLTVHFLDAGFETSRRRLVVLLHGFPELAYTWRNQLLPLADAGYHVVAPDLRGYGRTVMGPVSYDDDVAPYALLNRVSDMLGLVRALGYDEASVIGHDWGAYTAAWCGVARPDVFRAVAMISTPFAGTPELPLGSIKDSVSDAPSMEQQLAALSPPRKHYQWYSATREANENMWRAPQGLRNMLRAFYYFKSADWKGNHPFPLKSWSASELAKMPEYYVMQRDKGMAETVAAVMPSRTEIANCRWMTEDDLDVYFTEYERTGFQGGLNSYRISSVAGELAAFAGRTLDVPSCYIAGAKEWGAYQSPGALDAMKSRACKRLLGLHFVRDAGHSVPEEKPDEVNRLLVSFLMQALG